jgi:hypothetical protein
MTGKLRYATQSLASSGVFVRSGDVARERGAVVRVPLIVQAVMLLNLKCKVDILHNIHGVSLCTRSHIVYLTASVSSLYSFLVDVNSLLGS